MTAAIMAPAGRAKKVIPALAGGEPFFTQILADTLPFMHDDMQRVLFCQGLGQSIPDGLVFGWRQLWLKSAKEPVPDDQEHAHVLIQVPGIGTMVHTVVGGGDEKIFQETQLIDLFGMNQYAPGLRRSIYKGDIDGLKTEPGNRDKINETIERLQHGRTKAYRKIELGRGMMGDMRGPEEPAVMVHPVQPVVHEILEDDQQDPVQPGVLNGFTDAVVIEEGKHDTDRNDPEKQVDHRVQGHEVDILGRVL